MGFVEHDVFRHVHYTYVHRTDYIVFQRIQDNYSCTLVNGHIPKPQRERMNEPFVRKAGPLNCPFHLRIAYLG